MQAPTYTKSGTKATSATKLDPKIFGLEVSTTDLIKKAYLSDLANTRATSAKVKTRTEVRGGGKKPWQQKGTGNARAGSIRSPLWRGGGITFGPTGNENHSIQLSKKESSLATKQALSLSVDKIAVVDSLPGKTTKTAEAAKVIKKITPSNRVLIVVKNDENNNPLAIRNIASVGVVTSGGVNTRNVLDADTVLINKEALTEIESRLGDNK
jgi:large subunit ribosomal protein L4